MNETESRPDYFASTRWSVVRKAGGTDPQADVALEELCAACRRPVWQFILSRTGDSHAAEDLLPLMDKPGRKGLYDETVTRLGMSEGSLKVPLHRMRDRLGRHLLAIVSDTVSSPEAAQAELRYLFQALSYHDGDDGET